MSSPHHLRDRIFRDFFPPPRFLEMPAVGLDISETALTALELVRHKDGYAIGRFGSRPLPPGSISGGYVNDLEAVVGELRKLKDTLQLDFVNASLSEEKAYLFKAKIPHVAKKDIRSVLEFKLEENVPIPTNDAIFDYTIITQAGHDTSDHFDVGVTVLPRKVVETYTELLDAAGLVPLSFELEAQAVARSVIAEGDNETYLIVHFGENKTGLFIVSDEVVHFTSTVAVGGAHITDAIAKHLSISKEEAIVRKREHATFKDKKNMDLLLSLTEPLSALKSEVNKLSVYWHTHEDSAGEVGKKIQKIILCGRDAGFTGLTDYLSLALLNTVEVGNVWQNAFSLDDYLPSITRDESLDYAAAIGLALPRGQ